MAERRMFAKTIVLSDAFLDMPMSARCLYFTLGMLADDDGFVNAPRSIMRQCGASDDDMRILLAKKFVLEFESGVIVIKHWRINNYLQKDRIQPTKYVDEKAQLTLDAKGGYHKTENALPAGNSDVYTPMYTQNSIGKDSIGKCIDDGEYTRTCARDGMDRMTENMNKPQSAYDYLVQIGIDMSDPYIIDEYRDTMEMGFSNELVMYAASRAKSAGKISWAYIRSVLINWHENGIKTVEQAKEDLKKHRELNRRNHQGDSGKPRTEYDLKPNFV